MVSSLKGRKIAILIANGFEQVEMTEPKQALEQAGAHVDIISPEKAKVKGWKHTQWGDEFDVDVKLEQAKAENYDALMLPGPIAAICHGPWTLINAEAVKGRKLTSWPSIKIDLINAGAQWVDEQVVRDGKLVTSRKPDDIPAFNQEMIKLFAET